MSIDEIKNIKRSSGDLKKFGLSFGAVLCIGSLVLRWLGKSEWHILLPAGLAVAFLGLALPSSLRPVEKAFAAAGILISWVLTRVVLTLVFYLVVTPLGLAMRFLGKCPLDLSFPGERSKKSYWNHRPEERAEAVQMERQF